MFMFVFQATACVGGNKDITLEDKTLEYGVRYTIPNYERNLEIKVTNSSGATVKVTNGAFKPEVGTYAIEVKKGTNVYRYNLKCEDTTAPQVVFNAHVLDVLRGDKVGLPLFVKTDASVITEENVVLTVKNNSGKIIEYFENTDYSNNYNYYVDTGADTESKYYLVELSVSDPYGNVGKDTCTIYIHDEFNGTTSNDNVLYDFNSNDYINLIYTVDRQENFQAAITDSNPVLEGAEEDNQVLKLSSDANYKKVYTSLVFPRKNFRFSDAYKITAKVCTDRDIEWVKIENYKGKIGGATYNLKANEWRTIEVDPILMGYDLGNYDDNYNRFYITSRTNYDSDDNIGINLYVDDIMIVPNVVDENYVENKETFDNDSYLTRVYQNEYLDNAARTNPNREYQSSTSLFSIEDKFMNGESTPRKVLKVETTALYGGLVYMLPKRVAEEDIDSIVITMSHDYEVKHVLFGVLQADYSSGNFCERIEMGKIKTMNKYTLDGARIANGYNSIYTGIDSHVTGVWFSCIDDGRTGNIFYIDSIEIILK